MSSEADTPAASRFGAWAELSRLSNLPTVVSNVLVGLAAGYVATGKSGMLRQPPPPADLRLLWDIIQHPGLVIIIAIACLYLAGMMLNDLFDYAFDVVERPERPLPSRRINSIEVVGAVGALFLLAFILLVTVGSMNVFLWAGLLVAAMIFYDVLHKRHPATVWLMGACRGLVYFTAASAFDAAHTAVWWNLVAPLAVILTLYTVGITWIARMENAGQLDRRKWASLGMIALVWCPPLFGLHPISAIGMMFAIVAGIGVSAWLMLAARMVMHQPPRTREAVQTWLAGLCLIDAFFLTLMARPAFALVAVICFIITVTAHRRIAGT